MSDPIKDKVKGLLEQANLWKTNNKGNRGQINQNVGTVINGISEEALSEWFAELRGQIQRDNDYMKEAVTNAIDSVLVSKVAKIVAEAYHTHCLRDASEKEELEVTLRDIQNKAGSITTEIQAVIKECNGTKEKVDELVRRLNSLNEEIKAELRNILDLCKKILSEIRFANERIGKLTTLAKENKAAIADLKEIVLSYIRLAEQHHEESQRILDSQNERSSSPGLDEQTILAMRVWFDKISHDITERSISAEEIIGSIENQKQILKDEFEEVRKSLDGIGDLVKQYGRTSGKQLEELKKQLSQKAQETLQRQAELYSLALDTNQVVHELLRLIQQKQREKGAQKANLEKTGADPEKVKRLQKEIAGQSLMIDTLSETIAILQNNGKQEFHNEVCPFCHVEERRPAVGTQCECLVCGNIFTIGKPIDPNMSDISDERVQEDARQLENHRQEKRRKNESDGED